MYVKTKTVTRTKGCLLKYVIHLLFLKYPSHFYTKRNLKSKGCLDRAYFVDCKMFKKYKVFQIFFFSTTLMGF